MFVQLAGQPSILYGKNFNVVHYMQTVRPNVFIPAVCIGTIDFNRFIPLSLTLTSPGGGVGGGGGGHKISVKQDLFASLSPTFFI